MADDFNFRINREGYIKTYPTPKRKALNKIINEKPGGDDAVIGTRRPLTTKNAVRLLLHGTLKSQVCRYCLNVTKPLTELDQIMQVASKGTLFKVTIRDMVASFYPIKVKTNQNFPNKICDRCLDSIMQAYLFTQQCEQSERALRNCFDDVYEKVEKLDPIETPKKRGKRKAKPNHNIIYVEHENVIGYAQPIINLINTSSEILTPEDPVTNLECLKCSEVLPNIESLLNHEKQHPASMWYNCRMCGKSFPKRYQLKRHLQSHSCRLEETMDKAKDDSFICKECGSTYEKYTELLQHIEKHKFKIVLEHLLEHKMNKLCSVCLTKSSGMVDLERMICLHGGSPNLSGDRNLYSILASTLPDPKSYKYKELIIPREATIVRVVKKLDNQLPGDKSVAKINISNPIIANQSEINSAKELVHSEDTNMLNNTNDEVIKDDFSDKIVSKSVISNNSEHEDGSSIFFFSMPDTLQNYSKIHTVNEINSFTKDTNMLENNIGIDKQENLMKIVDDPKPIIANKLKDKGNSGIFFSLPKIVTNITKININDVFKKETIMPRNINQVVNSGTDQELLKNNIIPRQKINTDDFQPPTRLCKICWIFNKPTCKTCVEKKESNAGVYKINVINASNSKENSDIRNSCKYCWLFKHVSECGNCKRPTSNSNNQNFSSKTNDNVLLNIDYKVAGTTIKNYNEDDFVRDKSKDIGKAIDTNNNLKLDNIKDNKENVHSKSVKRAIENNIWDCHICLTKNEKNFEKCHCCDSKRFKGDDTVKFKFANQRFEFLIHSIETNPEKIDDNTKKLEENNRKIERNTEKHETSKKLTTESTAIENPSTGSQIIEDFKEPMDIEIINTSLLDSNLNAFNWKNKEKADNTVLIADDNKPNKIFRFGKTSTVDANLKSVTEQTSNNGTQYEAMDIVEDVNIIDKSHNNMPGNSKILFTPHYNLTENPSFGMDVNNENVLTPKYEFNIGNSVTNNGVKCGHTGCYHCYKAVSEDKKQQMNNLNNYTGTKICEKCLNNAINTYIFTNQFLFNRNRLNTCVTLMLHNLDQIRKPESSIFIEISPKTVLPIQEEVDDIYFCDKNDDIDETKLKVDVLEDEFRIELESDSDSVNDLIRVDNKNTKSVLVNGLQHNSLTVCSEFLTFKNRRKKVARLKYTCPICNKHFITDYHLKKHAQKHINKKTRCELCLQEFPNKFHLYEHNKMAHVLKVDYQSCDNCGRTFDNSKKIRKHYTTHFKKVCELCNKVFYSQKFYNNHIQRHRFKLNKYKKKFIKNCSFCEKDCIGNNELYRHINKEHIQIKPYDCEMCDKQFYTVRDLWCHRKIHSLFSKETCAFCNKELNCRRKLVCHVREHLGVTPFSCQVCGQAFHTKRKLRIHMKVYHGGNFCCTFCKKVFLTKVGLKEHINKAHSFI